MSDTQADYLTECMTDEDSIREDDILNGPALPRWCPACKRPWTEAEARISVRVNGCRYCGPIKGEKGASK